MAESYQALVVRESEDGRFTTAIETRRITNLPEGGILIRVHYSSINYKDGLSASGNKGVTRSYPHTPGIDAAGIVIESDSEQFSAGDEVVVIGFDLGMNTPGGYGQYIRVPAGWVVPLSKGLTLRESMILGTAGFTAAQSVDALLRHDVAPAKGPIVVSGATGGVGSVAVALLSQIGFEVTAATGKLDQEPFLRELGASHIIHRDEINDQSGRPLLRPTWAGAVDTVGGNTLATLIKTTRYGGAVTCCGLVAGNEFHSSVFPFILRGVALLGIDSVEAPLTEKKRIWHRLAADFKLANLETLGREVNLQDTSDELDRILKGEMRGRVIVKLF